MAFALEEGSPSRGYLYQRQERLLRLGVDELSVSTASGRLVAVNNVVHATGMHSLKLLLIIGSLDAISSEYWP